MPRRRRKPRPPVEPTLRQVRAAQALRRQGFTRVETCSLTGLTGATAQRYAREQYRQWRELRDTAARWLVAIGWTWQAVAASFGRSKAWRPPARGGGGPSITQEESP